MAINVVTHHIPQKSNISLLYVYVYRAASKDTELEGTYLRLLKESSVHEKAILRDLGRCVYCLLSFMIL